MEKKYHYTFGDSFQSSEICEPNLIFSDTHTRHQDQSSAFWQSVDRGKWGENEVEERNLFAVEPDVSELFAKCKKFTIARCSPSTWKRVH